MNPIVEALINSALIDHIATAAAGAIVAFIGIWSTKASEWITVKSSEAKFPLTAGLAEVGLGAFNQITTEVLTKEKIEATIIQALEGIGLKKV